MWSSCLVILHGICVCMFGHIAWHMCILVRSELKDQCELSIQCSNFEVRSFKKEGIYVASSLLENWIHNMISAFETSSQKEGQIGFNTIPAN
jgi:hypothetical protein